MAGLPSDQVTALAVVRELGSLPSVLPAFAQAVAAPAIHSPSARRTIDREIILSPFIRHRTFPQHYLATTGPYSVAAATTTNGRLRGCGSPARCCGISRRRTALPRPGTADGRAACRAL